MLFICHCWNCGNKFSSANAMARQCPDCVWTFKAQRLWTSNRSAPLRVNR